MPQKKSKPNKRKQSNLKNETSEPLNKEIADEEAALKDLKKLKIDSAKTSAKKSPVKSAEKEKNGMDEELPTIPENTIEEEKKGKEDDKKGSKAKEPKSEKKDPNQKSLMSFFKKKEVSSIPSTQESKATVEAPKEEKKSIFRCLGSATIRSIWDSERAQAFEAIWGKANSEFSTEDLLKSALNTAKIVRKRKPKKTARKIFISIHDSFRRIKGKFDQASIRIIPKNPFSKDEVQIDYDIDSEEEFENQVSCLEGTFNSLER